MSARKRAFFRLVVNVSILFMIEGSFRLLDLGGDTSFLLQEEIGDIEYLRINPSYAEKYTPRTNELVPLPLNYAFRKSKGKDRYRIYVLGESTSQGFPYPQTGTFPFRLEQMLNNAGTDKTFEVINMSMAATGSHMGLDIAREVVDFPPDLVILYLGSSEFVGIDRAGSWYTPSFQANMLLSQSWVYQTLKAQLSRLIEEDSQSLLEEQTQEEDVSVGVPLDSEAYRRTINQFRSNYEGIIKVLRESEVPIILCGVLSNLKDLPPFMPSGTTDRRILSEIEELLGEPETDDEKIRLIALVGDDAYLNFHVGSHLLREKNIELARFFLVRANDMDQLRLRPSSDINRTIQALAEKYDYPYVDIEKKFEERSSRGIVGNSLMADHVHPTLTGHSLIAQNLAETIMFRYLGMKPQDGFEEIGTFLTLVDHIGSSNKLFNLFNSSPYKDHHFINATGFESIYDTTNEGFIKLLSNGDLLQFIEHSPSYLKKEIDVDEYLEIVNMYFEFSLPAKVHVNLGVELCSREEYQAAYREFLVAANQNQENLLAWNNLGVLHFTFNEFEEALAILDTLCTRSPGYLDGCRNSWLVLDKLGVRDKADTIRNHLVENGVHVDDINHVTLYRFSQDSD